LQVKERLLQPMMVTGPDGDSTFEIMSFADTSSSRDVVIASSTNASSTNVDESHSIEADRSASNTSFVGDERCSKLLHGAGAQTSAVVQRTVSPGSNISGNSLKDCAFKWRLGCNELAAIVSSAPQLEVLCVWDFDLTGHENVGPFPAAGGHPEGLSGPTSPTSFAKSRPNVFTPMNSPAEGSSKGAASSPAEGSVTVLAEALAVATRLVKLGMRGCRAGDSLVVHLAGILRRGNLPRLMHLDLSHNDVGIAGAVALASALPYMPRRTLQSPIPFGTIPTSTGNLNADTSTTKDSQWDTSPYFKVGSYYLLPWVCNVKSLHQSIVTY
jgi:hypothetical protein